MFGVCPPLFCMYKVYCDFDATVTENDVWNVLFTQFGQPSAFTIWEEFNQGRLTAADCIRFACNTVHGADPKIAESLFRSQALRSGFTDFHKFCVDNKIELHIVSDGFSAYIRPILEENNLDIPFHANNIEVTSHGTLSVDFQNARESCEACGSCKCAKLLETSSDDDTIVYVGDGYSDVCPVKMADVVFARDTLLRFCSKNGIPHHPFADFFEVRDILSNYLMDRPKYKREQARRQRKALYMLE
jgi:2-hydroxy-3-keto-5-methylthiopentenyl-1-phosphate phosphatase